MRFTADGPIQTALSLNAMHKKTAKQLVLGLSGLTLGVALMLPDIDFWRAVGLAVLFVTAFLSSTEPPSTKRVASVLFSLSICMFLVVLSIFSDDVFAARTGGPRIWYVFPLIVAWLICGIWEYERWRRATRDPFVHAEL